LTKAPVVQAGSKNREIEELDMKNPVLAENTQNWRAKEVQARRAIEDHGFVVHDANIIFRQNCPNIDLVVYAQACAFYVQVKSSKKPAGANSVIIDGSPWTSEQLYDGAPIFNKHDHLRCNLVVILDTLKTGETHFYIAPPKELEKLVRPLARKLAKRPKRDGSERSIRFRKELPRALLTQWREAWHLFGAPLSQKVL
jgi:Holliday junction resolvase-like predicted endonuclease